MIITLSINKSHIQIFLTTFLIFLQFNLLGLSQNHKSKNEFSKEIELVDLKLTSFSKKIKESSSDHLKKVLNQQLPIYPLQEIVLEYLKLDFHNYEYNKIIYLPKDLILRQSLFHIMEFNNEDDIIISQQEDSGLYYIYKNISEFSNLELSIINRELSFQIKLHCDFKNGYKVKICKNNFNFNSFILISNNFNDFTFSYSLNENIVACSAIDNQYLAWINDSDKKIFFIKIDQKDSKINSLDFPNLNLNNSELIDIAISETGKYIAVLLSSNAIILFKLKNKDYDLKNFN